MKKTALRLISAALALMLALSLAACGDKKSASSSAPESSSKVESSASSESKAESSEPASSAESKAESSEPASSAESKTESAAAGTYPTVTAFMQDNRDIISASIENIAKDQDQMEVSLDCTDNSIIYKFVFTESAMEGVDSAALAEVLEEQINSDDSFADTFMNIATSVKSVVPQQESVTVEVVYSTYDGTELVHKTYSSGID